MAASGIAITSMPATRQGDFRRSRRQSAQNRYGRCALFMVSHATMGMSLGRPLLRDDALLFPYRIVEE